MMRYLYVKWAHETSDDPVHLYSEIDEQFYECRKVEIYNDGRRGFADSIEEVGGTRLGIGPLPTFEEIAAQPEFEPRWMSEEEFREVWLKRK